MKVRFSIELRDGNYFDLLDKFNALFSYDFVDILDVTALKYNESRDFFYCEILLEVSHHSRRLGVEYFIRKTGLRESIVVIPSTIDC